MYAGDMLVIYCSARVILWQRGCTTFSIAFREVISDRHYQRCCGFMNGTYISFCERHCAFMRGLV